MKKLIVLYLLIQVLMQPLIGQESPNNKPSSAKQFGIDLTKDYSGKEVSSFIDIIMDEADASIAKAYGEGYKAGLIEIKPENARLTVINEGLRKKLEAEQSILKLPLWTAPVFILSGITTGIIITLSVRR